ncbi:hypothetical protein [Streptomyces sp. SID13726]|uniref:hypothetical protein n=1 Tax=Streptomyces sp. SID13726 TaxID=2706058 RepID=UPI0013BCC44A|nr:hypothetical protein [Streptomyces sp. SID13726]NEB00336.1 hypothetical protein [Streptomyces sp. SID13726]
MPLDDQRMWALLRELDDPDHMEFPRGYDHTATRARFDRLAAGLDRCFRCACSVDRGVQDASHHGTILVPAAATDSGDHISVTVSNFGDLVAVTLGNPGSYGEEEEDLLLERTDRQRLDAELGALGYVTVSEHLLRARYDGVSRLAASYPAAYPPTWWTRFFDYL